MGVDTGIRIRDLVNPEKKMSKSTDGENCKIMLSDDPDKAAKKIMSATTDSLEKIDFNLETQPGISNLLQIEALVNDVPLGEVIREWSGKTRYGDLKKQVSESVKTLLVNFQQKLAETSDDTVKNLLPAGEEYANEVANKKLADVYAKVGLR